MIYKDTETTVSNCLVRVSGGQMDESEARVYIQLKRQQYQHAPAKVHFTINGNLITAVWSYNDAEDAFPRLAEKTVKDAQPMLQKEAP